MINPATGKSFATVPEATAADLEEAIAGSAAAYKTWSKTPYAERAGKIKKLRGDAR